MDNIILLCYRENQSRGIYLEILTYADDEDFFSRRNSGLERLCKCFKKVEATEILHNKIKKQRKARDTDNKHKSTNLRENKKNINISRS